MLNFLIFSYLKALKISCSAKLSMIKRFITSRPGLLSPQLQIWFIRPNPKAVRTSLLIAPAQDFVIIPQSPDTLYVQGNIGYRAIRDIV